MVASFFFVGASGALLLAALPAARRTGRQVWRFRGTRVAHCPEAGRPAGVAIDLRALAFGTRRGTPRFRVRSCSRWPEHRGCRQGCLTQIERAPVDSLPRVLLRQWYVGKSCALCTEPFGPGHLFSERPCVMRPDGRTVAWSDIPAEQVPEVLATHRPICRACHLAATFGRILKGDADRPWNRYAAWAAARRVALARKGSGAPPQAPAGAGERSLARRASP